MKKIDVFVDEKNLDNCWGLISSKDSNNPLVRWNQEFIRFNSYYQMERYLKIEFKDNEIKRHHVDYNYIEYQFNPKDPKDNKVVIKYHENNYGKEKDGKVELPEEFEQIFVDIIRINKKIPPYYPIDSRYYRSVDVVKRDKENINTMKMELSEFFKLAGNKIKNLKNDRKAIKNISLIAAIVVLGATIGEGYCLVRDNEYHSEFLRQENPIRSVQDIGVFLNKGNYGVIIDKLVHNQYEDIDEDDIKRTINYLKNVEARNYDNNDSFNFINYNNYFKYNADSEEIRYQTSQDVLQKIEKYYNECFTRKVFNPEKATKFIDYVASLTFMYDVYHDTRLSYVSIDTQSIVSPYATIEEIKTYDNYPPILRYIILNQLKAILSRVNYVVEVTPSYYFKSTDKHNLMEDINKKLSSIEEELLRLVSKSVNK